jgi:hypothetical protein
MEYATITPKQLSRGGSLPRDRSGCCPDLVLIYRYSEYRWASEYVLVPTLSICRLYIDQPHSVPNIIHSLPFAMTEAKYIQTLHSVPKETFLVRPIPYLTDISSVHLRSNTYRILQPPLVGELRYGQRGKIVIPVWRMVGIKSEKYVPAFLRKCA